MPANDDSKLFHYATADAFVEQLQKFLRGNGHSDVQSHDFRVSRACELFIDGFSIDRLMRYFNHSSPEITSMYIKDKAYVAKENKLSK